MNVQKLAIGILIFLCMASSSGLPAQAEGWYQPTPADFRPVYDRDPVNKLYESWDGGNGYWFWVESFYNGYAKKVLGLTVFRQTGWTATGQALEGRLRLPSTRAQVRAAWNTLGRTVAGEWAKDDGHCRINTNDLKRWGEQVRRAAGRDPGNGKIILAAAASIQAEADRRLAGPLP